MTISSRSNHLIYPSNISRLQTLILNLQRWNHTLVQNGGEDEYINSRSTSSRCYDYIDKSSWKNVDARFYGVSQWNVSESSWIALSLLRRKGFKAYLVGGCVRDLLLHRIPKDFDVITTATLKEIKKLFHKARVVGTRFPICHVHLKNSMVEVSSFDTVAKDTDAEEKVSQRRKPTGCNRIDFTLWQNCLRRDFTINSLFYDPSTERIYDYTDGMRDLKQCKVQTVIPAHLSFKEDCARILRGVRIAARLGLSFSDETATAIKDLCLSIMDLSKGRLEMEMDYMFSYGAAESSLNLLKRFKILDILLPFHAAYLSAQGHDQNAQKSSMLCKLFSSVDKLTSCDRPCNSSLWVGVLAIHLALVNHPRDALVVWTFSSLLYYGMWEDALKVAREKSNLNIAFEPEIRNSCCSKSDEELAEDVKHFASQVTSFIDALTEPQCLVQAMARFPLYPCSDFVCISKAKGRAAAKVFNALLKDVESYSKKRRNFEINYELLKGGYMDEIRFVLGKVMMNTMNAGVVQDQELQAHLPLSKLVEESNITTLHQHEQRHVLGNEKDLRSSKVIEESNITTRYQHDQRNMCGNEKDLPLSKVVEESNITTLYQHDQRHIHGNEKDLPSSMVVEESNITTLYQHDQSHMLGNEKDGIQKFTNQNQVSNTDLSCHFLLEKGKRKVRRNFDQQQVAENENDCLQHSNAKRKVERVLTSSHLIQKGEGIFPVINAKQVKKKVKEDEHQQSESNQEHMVEEPQPQVPEHEKDRLQNPNAKRKVVEEERVQMFLKTKLKKKVEDDEHQQSESDKKHMVKKPAKLSLLFKW